MASSFLRDHELRCAVELREEYLRRLQFAILDQPSSPHLTDIGNNLDMLRTATVEVVEALVRWRQLTGVSSVTCSYKWCDQLMTPFPLRGHRSTHTSGRAKTTACAC